MSLKSDLEEIQDARDSIKSALNANGANVGNDIRTFATGVNSVASVKTVNNISADNNKNVTITAEDIVIKDSESEFYNNTISSAVNDLVEGMGNLGSSLYSITIAETTTTSGYAKTYTLKVDNEEVGVKINIPKDLVVNKGEVKIVITADTPYTGAKVGDKYIDLELNDSTQNHIYIPVKDLVDVYTGVDGAKITVSINGSNQISATIKAGTIELTDLVSTLRTKINSIDNKSKATNLLNGSAAGSVRTVNSQSTIGQYAFAEGNNTKASGDYSHAECKDTTASGNYSHAEGINTKASSKYSHAEGLNTTASGMASHVEGSGTEASGEYQHVQGKYNIQDTNNKYAHIVGNGTDGNNKSNAHTIDWNGLGWFAGGLKVGGTGQDDTNAKIVATTDQIPTIPSDLPTNLLNGSTTGSLRTIGSKSESDTYTMGQYAFAEGFRAKASSSYSHAEGGNTTASGSCSHSEGSNTTASGSCSHAEGYGTAASGSSQHTQGKYNIEDTASKYAHIVGNGTADNARSNAHTLDWNGNAWYQGDIYVGGTDQDTNSKRLVSEATIKQDYYYADGTISPDSALQYMKEAFPSYNLSSILYIGEPGTDGLAYTSPVYDSSTYYQGSVYLFKYVKSQPMFEDSSGSDYDARGGRNEEYGAFYYGTTNITLNQSASVNVDLAGTNITSAELQYQRPGSYYRTVATLTNPSSGYNTFTFKLTDYYCDNSSIPFRVWLTYSDGRSGAITQSPSNPENQYTIWVSSGGGAACFVGNTLVETQEGPKAIKDIEEGDLVLSVDAIHNAKKEYMPVSKIITHQVERIYNIKLETDEVLSCTEDHPFYTSIGTVYAKDLSSEISLVNNIGNPVKIKRVTNKKAETNAEKNVYEIKVDKNYNYYVGETKILVHNEGSTIKD